MHGYMLKLGNPFLTQWQRRYFYLFPNRLEWRGEGESRVSLQRRRSAFPWWFCIAGVFVKALPALCVSSNLCMSDFSCSYSQTPLKQGKIWYPLKIECAIQGSQSRQVCGGLESGWVAPKRGRKVGLWSQRCSDTLFVSLGLRSTFCWLNLSFLICKRWDMEMVTI